MWSLNRVGIVCQAQPKLEPRASGKPNHQGVSIRRTADQVYCARAFRTCPQAEYSRPLKGVALIIHSLPKQCFLTPKCWCPLRISHFKKWQKWKFSSIWKYPDVRWLSRLYRLLLDMHVMQRMDDQEYAFLCYAEVMNGCPLCSPQNETRHATQCQFEMARVTSLVLASDTCVRFHCRCKRKLHFWIVATWTLVHEVVSSASHFYPKISCFDMTN